MKKLALALFCVLLCNLVYSQAEINVKYEGVTINNVVNSSIEQSAVFDVESNSKGVIFPRLSLQQRNDIENPAEGLLLYNSTLHTYEFYNGTEWVAMSGGINYETPPVPVNFMASAASYNQIDLSWSIDTTDPVQFVIERRKTNSPYQIVATIQSGNFSYSDINGLIGNTEYFYRIKSSFGADSEYSAEISSTTLNQALTYNIGTSASRIAPNSVFEHGGNFSSYPSAVGLYPLSYNQVRFMEKSYIYSDNWRKWTLYAGGSLVNTKAIFYDLATNNEVAEIELSYTQIASNTFTTEFILPASVNGDFVLRIQKTSNAAAQLYQITKMIQEGL